MNTDILIIGGGPTGIEAALTASTYSNSVTLVTNGRVGEWKAGFTNICLNNVEKIRNNSSFSIELFQDIYNDWMQHQEQLLLEAGIHVITGSASFVNEHFIKVIDSERNETVIFSNKIIIANGARPIFPEKIQPNGKSIFSYNTLNHLNKIPKSILIIGDGSIGFEMVNLFMQLGSNVTWLLPEVKNSLLDEDTSNYMEEFYTKNGVCIIRGPWIDKLKICEGIVQAIRQDNEVFESEVVFISLGFRSNVDLLEVENANLQLNKYGSINCNEYGQTAFEHIYIVGDALLPFSNTVVHSKTSAQIVALHAVGQKNELQDLSGLPIGFNENPQIAVVGQYNTLRKEVQYTKVPYEMDNFQAFMTNKREGFLKIVSDHNGLIIGASCVGHQAKEVISVIALMIKLQVTINDAATFAAVHPSAAELPLYALRKYVNTKKGKVNQK
jgi:pyruvate/2-oxoglutarate dehydrogenase complex dihydrolipoamide dehydrogenase (E3) component